LTKLIRAVFISAIATAFAVGMVSLLSRRLPRLPGRDQTRLPGEIDPDDLGAEQAAVLMRELNAHL